MSFWPFFSSSMSDPLPHPSTNVARAAAMMNVRISVTSSWRPEGRNRGAARPGIARNAATCVMLRGLGFAYESTRDRWLTFT